MKKQWISLSFLASSVFVFSQELPKSENYIHSRVYLEETQETNAAKKQLETVAYYDGLGRPKQNIGVKASPKGRDVVTHIEYDEFGRRAKDFLPIPQSGTQTKKYSVRKYLKTLHSTDFLDKSTKEMTGKTIL